MDEMVVVAGVAGLDRSVGRLFVVVGVFDGIHRGHAYLLRRLVQGALARGARPAVLTFDHHPDEILVGAAPPLLLAPDERLARLAAADVAVTIVQHFDEAVRATPFDVFVESIRDRVELAGFLMTPDAAFGYRRAGTPAALAALGAAVRPGFDVEVIPPHRLDGRPVRSTDVREAIAAGDLTAARRLLGRAHAVVAGPTGTGVDPSMPIALPPPGQYAVRVGRPWSPGWRGVRSTATVGQGTVALEPAGAALQLARVAFDAPLEASAPGDA